MYMTVKQAAEKWGISDRRVRILCSEGKIPDVTREGRSWKIPEDAKKPEDGRYKTTENLVEKIDRKKTELDSRRPLTEGEVERLTEEFVVEYTYNSNAIEGNTLTYTAMDCRVQTARSRKGMPFHPCKSVGIIEYREFAKVIDPRFTCQCVSCYPDITDETCCCKWKFTLEE